MKNFYIKLFFLISYALISLDTLQADEGKMPLGICVHLQKASKAEIDRQLDAVALAKFKLIRWDISWQNVEQSKGKLAIDPKWDYIVDSAKARGIESIIIFDYGNKFYDDGKKPVSNEAVGGFVRYASFLAKHFKGRVAYYEVWNEWNGDVGGAPWGKTRDYISLLKATYPAVKRVDPNTKLIAGSFINYLRDNDSLQQFVEPDAEVEMFTDVIGLHPYVVYRGKELNNSEGFEKLLRSALSKIKSNPKLQSKPVMITEIGWNTAIDHPSGVSEGEQSVFLESAIKIARNLNIDGLIVYHLKDNNGLPNDSEGNFGLLRRDWSQKSAYRLFINNPAGL